MEVKVLEQVAADETPSMVEMQMATLIGAAEAATHDREEVATKVDGGSNPFHLLSQIEKEHTSSDEARSQQERTRVRRRREK